MSQVVSRILRRKVTAMSNPSAQNLEETTTKKIRPHRKLQNDRL